METAIFGLRFKSHEALQPAIEDLRLFLESPRKDGKKETHGDDLADYLQHLARVEEFEKDRQRGMGRTDFHEKMLLGVLSHSQFFTASLKSAVEQYKYHYHTLMTIDLRKPLAFIKSAEEEIKRFNPKNKDDQAKRDRLQAMIDQRSKDLETLKKRWPLLGDELHHIAVYITDNLLKIRKLCESSITVLVGLQIGGEKTGQLIEDIKAHFKEQVRDYLQLGPVTKQYVESLQEDVAKLSKQLSQQVLEDTYAVTRVYEALHDHAQKIGGELDGLIRQVKAKQHKSIDEDRDLFGRIEQSLISLVSDHHLDTAMPKDARSGEKHDRLLIEKRKEMLDHLFDLLKKGMSGQG
jgi:hypothetical protein